MSGKTVFFILFSICLFLPTMFWTGFTELVASHPLMMQEVNPHRVTLESLPPEYTEFTARWRETFNEVRLTEVSPNKVAIWWIYNAGFLIKTPKYVIAIDLDLPWVTNLSADDLDMIDVLVITHPHGDHYDPKVAQNIKNGTLIVCPPSMTVSTSHQVRIEQLGWWESTTYSEINVTAIPSYHGEYEGYANGYVITTDNGIKMMHTDDNPWCYPEMSQIGTEMRPDILLLNVWCGSGYIYETGYINETANVVQAVQPRLVILMHLYEFGHSFYQVWTYEQANNVKENLASVMPEVTVIIPTWGQQCVADEWSMFRHDLGHTGYSTSSVPNGNFTAWTYETGDAVGSSPAVADGLVFVGSYDHKVYALNATTGVEIWNYTTSNMIFSSPAVADGMVFIASIDNKTYALNETTGAEIWSYETGYVWFSSPMVADGKVFVGSNDNRVYALNETTGVQIWNYTTENYVWSSPAVADGMVFVGSLDKNVYALNASTGAKIWNHTTGGAVGSSPAVVDGMVFVGSHDHKVYALNETTGELIWNYTTGDLVWSSPAVAYDMVFVGSLDNRAYALNKTTGELIWNYTTNGFVWSSPAVACGEVFIGSDDNKTYALDAFSGELVWSYETGGRIWSSPSVAYGKVFIGSNDSKVYCFIDDTTPPSISSPKQEPPSEVPPDQQVTVSVNVTDNRSGVHNVTLWYTLDDGETWKNITMEKTVGDTYVGVIQGLPAGTTVKGKFVAYDYAENIAVSKRTYIYTVIPEFPAWSSVLVMFLLLATVMIILKKRMVSL